MFHRGTPRGLGLLLSMTLAAACGAKTGLLVPDAGTDAGVDAGTPHDCVPLPFEAQDVELDLQTDAELAVADVMFVVDATASMGEEIDNIRRRLRDRIVPGIAEELPDVEFGVAAFADFANGRFGSGDDEPFRLLLPITGDLVAAQAAVDEIPDDWDGRDLPESQVEALYQTATGEGLPRGNGLSPWVPPAPGCPSGGVGYPCFRREAISIVILITDAPFHNGPDGDDPYGDSLAGDPHDYAEAIDALQEIDARFIGLDSGDDSSRSREHMTRTARDLGSVTVDGQPLVFDIGTDGNELGEQVVHSVRTLADAVRFDVDAVALDVPGDAYDATQFVVSIRPSSAEPASGVESFDETTFYGVIPGTRVVFLLTLRNDSMAPGPEPILIPLRIVFRGDGHSPIAERIVDLLIPGKNDPGECPE